MMQKYQEICDDFQVAQPKYRMMCLVGDYPAIRQVRFEASVWDPEEWPESDVKEQATIIKTKAQKGFLLTNNDMMGLEYTKGWVHNYQSKCYSVRAVERTAWEKYGGPSGFKAALEAKYPEDWRKTGKKKTAPKTKSSGSKAVTDVEGGHAVGGPSKGQKSKRIFVPKVEDVIEID